MTLVHVAYCTANYRSLLITCVKITSYCRLPSVLAEGFSFPYYCCVLFQTRLQFECAVYRNFSTLRYRIRECTLLKVSEHDRENAILNFNSRIGNTKLRAKQLYQYFLIRNEIMQSHAARLGDQTQVRKEGKLQLPYTQQIQAISRFNWPIWESNTHRPDQKRSRVCVHSRE